MGAEIAVITGAGSGIGMATSILFSQMDFHVLGLDLDRTGLEETRSKIKEQRGHFEAFQVDISDASQVSDFFSSISETRSPLRSVVNCAGIASTGLAHEDDGVNWDRHINVNLTGTYNVARHAMRSFLTSGFGTFTAISSDAGIRGASGYSAYCASKHGVIGLVRCLALDYGQFGIRSNVICPGFVETRMMDSLFNESKDPASEKKSYAKEIPLGRFAKPSEVARVALHLASEESRYTNGLIYMLDGGATCGHFDP